MGQTDVVADQATAMLDELLQGAHGGALGVEWDELVVMFQEDVDQKFGIGGVIFGPARGKGFAVLGYGERVDGKEHKAIIGAQRGYDRSFIEFQAHSDRLTVETRPEGLDPGMNRFRTKEVEAHDTEKCSAGLSGLCHVILEF